MHRTNPNQTSQAIAKAEPASKHEENKQIMEKEKKKKEGKKTLDMIHKVERGGSR